MPSTSQTRFGVPLAFWVTTGLGLAVGMGVGVGMGTLVAAALAGLAYYVLLAARPQWVLAACILLVPLTSTFSLTLGGGIPTINFLRATAPALVMVWLVRRSWLGEASGEPMTGAERWLVIFMLLFSVGMLLPVYLKYSMNEATQYLLSYMDACGLPFLMFWMARDMLSADDRVPLVLGFGLVAGLTFASIGLAESVLRKDLMGLPIREDVDLVYQGLRSSEGMVRSNGPFTTQEGYGMVTGMLALLAVLDLSMHVVGRRLGPGALLRLLAIPVMVLGVAASLFRAILGGVIFGFLARVFCIPRIFWRYVMLGLLLAVLLMPAYMWFTQTDIYQNRVADAETGLTRVATWIKGLRVAPDYLLVGAGFGNYTQAQAKYRYVVTYKNAWTVNSAHNALLNTLVEGGVVGLLGYVGMLGCLGVILLGLRKNGRTQPDGPETAAAMLGMLVVYFLSIMTLTAHTIPEVNGVFFVLMGFFAGRSRVFARKNAALEPDTPEPDEHDDILGPFRRAMNGSRA